MKRKEEQIQRKEKPMAQTNLVIAARGDGSARPNELKPKRFFEPVCSKCSDLGWVEGRKCECFIRRRIAEKLARLNRRYAKFAHLDLMSLVADPTRHQGQKDLIPRIQAKPDSSMILFGGTGSGKTMIGYVMAKYAIESGRPVAAITLSELLDQYRAQFSNSDRLPVVDAETLREPDGRYLIFIDEACKARPTQFAGEKFFHLINAASEAEQQVIIASNKSKPMLMAHWERANVDDDSDAEFSCYGEPIMRRLCEMKDAIEVSLF
jgi:DNA replication protein DnaC